MRKILVPIAAIMIFAACDKNDNNPNPIDPVSYTIQGQWKGDYYVRIGYIDGVAIEEKDSSLNDIVKTMDITLKHTDDGKDSVNGTVGTDTPTPIKGVYTLNEDVHPNTLEVDLGMGEPVVAAVDVTEDKMKLTQGKKETVEIGGQTADSTVTVISFNRVKNN